MCRICHTCLFCFVFIFGCVGSSLLHAVFSLQWRLLLQSSGSRHAGLSSCGSLASVVVARRLQSTGSVVVAHGLSCFAACGIFPEPVSTTLAGRFLTTVPPGKPCHTCFLLYFPSWLRSNIAECQMQHSRFSTQSSYATGCVPLGIT